MYLLSSLPGAKPPHPASVSHLQPANLPRLQGSVQARATAHRATAQVRAWAHTHTHTSSLTQTVPCAAPGLWLSEAGLRRSPSSGPTSSSCALDLTPNPPQAARAPLLLGFQQNPAPLPDPSSPAGLDSCLLHLHSSEREPSPCQQQPKSEAPIPEQETGLGGGCGGCQAGGAEQVASESRLASETCVCTATGPGEAWAP